MHRNRLPNEKYIPVLYAKFDYFVRVYRQLCTSVCIPFNRSSNNMEYPSVGVCVCVSSPTVWSCFIVVAKNQIIWQCNYSLWLLIRDQYSFHMNVSYIRLFLFHSNDMLEQCISWLAFLPVQTSIHLKWIAEFKFSLFAMLQYSLKWSVDMRFYLFWIINLIHC